MQAQGEVWCREGRQGLDKNICDCLVSAKMRVELISVIDSLIVSKSTAKVSYGPVAKGKVRIR